MIGGAFRGRSRRDRVLILYPSMTTPEGIPMDAAFFADKWRKSIRSEKSAAQEHFFDLCELVGHPKPGDVDSKGLKFTTERRVKKSSGGYGFADAFKAGCFAIEYKGKGADLNAAFNQLLQYSGDLGNPPLLVVSDMDRIEIRTRFTGYPTELHVVTLHDLAKPGQLATLRRMFFEPESFRPEKTIEKITEEAAADLAELAGVRERYPDPARVAHFLNRLIFCLFAEDAGLLPAKVFSKIVENYETRDSRRIAKDIGQLFEEMARGGDFYGEEIPHFNGSLFDNTPALDLNGLELEVIHKAAALDWSAMDPTIFGTLFERVMDPDQRSQLGAHYTSFADIATLVEPVVMTPLRREWEECRTRVESLLPPAPDPLDGAEDDPGLFPKPDPSKFSEAEKIIKGFLKTLRSVRVLDPACGSGNFLYVTLRMLKDLEYEALVFSRRHDLPEFPLEVGPHQLFGIEINPYAFDLAQMTVWIGFIQWHTANGFSYDRTPLLQPLRTIENKDAILDLSAPEFPAEPTWPEADFIIGNPPFLGGNKLRRELGDEYIDAVFSVYNGRVGGTADLCCYWFEKAREQIQAGKCTRAGLLATQAIRGGVNREVLKAIKKTGDIFFAESDRDWILDGASVHVSMVGFDNGSETLRQLDQKNTGFINADLTASVDVTLSGRLAENLNLWCYGSQQKAKFDIQPDFAMKLLRSPTPSGLPNSDVIKPSVNGSQVLRERRETYVIDFGLTQDIAEAACYEAPFKYVEEKIYPGDSIVLHIPGPIVYLWELTQLGVFAQDRTAGPTPWTTSLASAV